MVQESIKRSKEQYQQQIENLVYRPRQDTRGGLFAEELEPDFDADEVSENQRPNSQNNSTNDSSDKQE